MKISLCSVSLMIVLTACTSTVVKQPPSKPMPPLPPALNQPKALAVQPNAFALIATTTPSVTLAWNPVPPLTNVMGFSNAVTGKWQWTTNIVKAAGYRVYQGGATQFYTNKVDVGSATNVQFVNLLPGSKYYFAATSYATNAESAFSTEAVYTVPIPNQKKTIMAITGYTDGSSDMVSWTNIYTSPTVYLTNTIDPAFLQFLRTRSQVIWWQTNSP